MPARHIVTVAAILLALILVVGLVLCRPTAASRYASGIFNLAAVTEAQVSASGGDGDTRTLILTGDDAALVSLVELFDGRGFGMTPAGLFSHDLPESKEGEMWWSVTLRCSLAGSSLTAEYRGGRLCLTGGSRTLVTTQNKDTWARQVYDLIVSLYPEPEEE